MILTGGRGPSSETNFSFVVSYSTNGGGNWTRCNLSDSNFGFCYTLAVASSRTEVVYAGGEVGGYGGVYRSTNSGVNWVQTTAPVETVFCLAVDPREFNLVYAATPGGLYRTTDGGSDWTKIFHQPGLRVVKIFPDTPDTILVAGDSGVTISPDAGNTWQAMNEGLESLPVTSLEFVKTPELRLLAGTNGGAGYRWSFPIGIKEKPPASVAHLLFSPNPAGDRIFVPTNGAVIRLALYDALGRKVWQASGAQTAIIDLSHLPTGVYHLEAQTEPTGRKVHRRLTVVH